MANDFNVAALFEALDAQRTARDLTWSGVAREIEQQFTRVSAGTISGIQNKKTIEGDGVLQMLLWLDRSPESFVAGLDNANQARLTVAEGKVLRFDVVKTYADLNRKRDALGLNWQQVAEQIGGVPVATLKRFKSGGRTSFPGIMRIAVWLQQPVHSLTRETPW